MHSKMQHIFIPGAFQKSMRKIPKNSVDFVMGNISMDLDPNLMWQEVDRVLKPGGMVALFSQANNSHELICSNPNWYRAKYYYLAPNDVCEILLFGPTEPKFRREPDEEIYRLAGERGSHSGGYTVINCLDEVYENRRYEEIPWQIVKLLVRTFTQEECVTLDLNVRDYQAAIGAADGFSKTHISLHADPVKMQKIMEESYNATIFSRYMEYYLH